MKFYAVFGVLAALALNALADETKDSIPATVSSAIDRATAVTKATIASDTNETWSLIPSSYGAALAAGGAVVIGVVVLLAISAIVSPLFGYRLCQIFSTCDVPAAGTGYSADAYQSYPPTYNKRSIEYVKPILQVLNSAYEKYGHGAIPAGLANTMRNVNAQQ
ncbi:uncharacterized protein LOC113550031 isoform X1 [Rhopalosiphum maidis]|uniref:uncharacterized protein LOC113550031 isoform X1 n=1 Tax=Rhopalosiphum maidis TaxID=43146 RepID=UPI000EFEC2C2|nr:uncharacterized protein LOC113550031 isoform X1 [Rhopalosiphum maidis]XP_060835800.1 uncharacterized protein LOC132918552 isoform X1 [Rhopalosiphum padi]